MRALIQFIQRYVILNKAIVAALNECVEAIDVSKGDYLLQPGQMCRNLWFVESGMIRKYYLHQGKEITTWIHCEHEMVTSLTSYFQQQPSTEYLQVCEKSRILTLSVSGREQLNPYPPIHEFGRRLMAEQLALIDQVGRQLQNSNAKEKYDWLVSYAPQLAQRAQLGHIASLLGMTQETLSRIRSHK